MISSHLGKNSFHRFIAYFLVGAIFFSASPFNFQAHASTEDFSDVSAAHPYYVAINFLKENKVLTGYDDGTFRSENQINKAEATKLIVTSLKAALDVPYEPVFTDMPKDVWYSPYVMKAQKLGFVKGNGDTDTFTGDKAINLAEFLKMIILANEIDVSSFEGKTLAKNISAGAWFSNYINHAISLGIVPLKADGTVDPAKMLTRGEVANMMYLLAVILRGSDTPFLLTRAEAELAQIEVYIAANQVDLAKNAAELAVEFTQQAYGNAPTDNKVLAKAKIARAYDWLVEAFILGIQKKNVEAAQKANDVIDKATEAWEADNSTQPIAAHIKERAREILVQVDGVED